MTVRQRIKLLVWVLLLGMGIGWPVAAHYRAKAQVRECLRQLRLSGEKLTVGELAPPSSADNFRRATALLGAAGRLSTTSLTDLPPAMRYIAPGRALLTWKEPVVPTSDSPDIWPGLSRVMEQRADVLADVRAALASGTISFDLDYSQGFTLLLPHLATLKIAAQWLSAATILKLHEGNSDEAFDNLQALTGLLARHQEEPVMISELVRIAIGQIALNATWEALQWPYWQDQQLQTLQAAWESVDLLAQAEGVLAMERVTGEQVFAKARESFAAINNLYGSGGSSAPALNELAEFGRHLLEDPKDAFKGMSDRYPRYWAWRYWRSYEDEIVSLRVIQAALEALRKARAEKALDPALQQFQAAVRQLRQAHPKAGGWMDITAVLNGGVDRFFSRITAFERQRSLLLGALALKRYELEHHALPANLAELAPKFVAGVPCDFITGQPLHYRREPDGAFGLYSAGENGRDDGGDPTPGSDQANSTFKQWWRGRDAVWPRPASTEQLGAYFQKLLAERASKSEPGNGTLGAAAMDAFQRRYGLLPPAAAPPPLSPPAGRK